MSSWWTRWTNRRSHNSTNAKLNMGELGFYYMSRSRDLEHDCLLCCSSGVGRRSRERKKISRRCRVPSRKKCKCARLPLTFINPPWFLCILFINRKLGCCSHALHNGSHIVLVPATYVVWSSNEVGKYSARQWGTNILLFLASISHIFSLSKCGEIFLRLVHVWEHLICE